MSGIVKYVEGRLQKAAIHAAAVGIGAAAVILGNEGVSIVHDLGVPALYAGAIGAAIGDGLRVLFLELRTIDPDFEDPAGPVAA